MRWKVKRRRMTIFILLVEGGDIRTTNTWPAFRIADENWPFVATEREQVDVLFGANWYIYTRRRTVALPVAINEHLRSSIKLAQRKCITFGFGSISSANGVRWESHFWDNSGFLETNKRQIDLLHNQRPIVNMSRCTKCLFSIQLRLVRRWAVAGLTL